MRIPISQEPVSSEEGEGAPCSRQRSERAPAEARAQAASPRPSALARGVRSAARPGPLIGGTGMVLEGKIGKDRIDDVRVAMIGPIRQELLSGIPSQAQFEALKEKLQALEDLPLGRSDYERAAGFYNTCRSRRGQGSRTELLICAVGAGMGMPVFTSDKDSVLYARRLPISLHRPAGATGA